MGGSAWNVASPYVVQIVIDTVGHVSKKCLPGNNALKGIGFMRRRGCGSDTFERTNILGFNSIPYRGNCLLLYIYVFWAEGIEDV